MKLNLIVMTPGKSEGKAIPITLSQFLIGRDPQCQLRPASVSISKRHCAILVRSGKVFIHDLDSTNGTFVNDQPVKGETELHHQDKLKIGPLLFGVQIDATKPTVNKPTPAPASQATTPTPAPPTPGKPTTPMPKKPPQSEPADDESVAAWLLSMEDEGGATPGGESEVPGGSTVVLDQAELNKDKKTDPDAAAATAQDSTPKTKDKLAQAKALQADTADVAKAILQKYMRRPRGG